jgi:hypothetical protein
MHVVALAIPLTALLTGSPLCATAFAPLARFGLNACADLAPVFAGDPGLYLVLCAQRSGFPCTDAAAHQRGAVGFPNLGALDKEGEPTHIPSVVIHLDLAALQPGEQAGTDVPAPLKRESVS